MIVKSIISFNAGEFSPWLDARIDLEKYGSGCRRLENFLLTPYGGCRRRPGTEYVAEVRSSSEAARLIPFRFNVSTNYILVLNNGFMRFGKGGTGVSLVESGGSPVEVATPWTAAQLQEIQYAQINDVMYLTHPEVSPRKLVRASETSWTLSEVSFDFPLYRDENTSDITVTPSHTTGTGRTLTASADYFTEGMVGAKFQIGRERAHNEFEVSVDLTAAGANESSELLINGGFQFVTTSSSTWQTTTDGISIMRAAGISGGVFVDVRTWVVDNDRNISYGGTETDGLHRYKIQNNRAASAGHATANLEASDTVIYGEVTITGYTSATSVTVTIDKPLASLAATKRWSEGAMSTYRGFPRALTFHENRLCLGGIPGDPHAIYGSVTNDYENFQRGTNDDDSYLHRLLSGEHNAVQWMISERVLLIGTEAGEFVVAGSSSGSQDAILTPTNVRAKRHSNFGSAPIQATFINDAVLYAQRAARKIREYGYVFERDRYQAADVTILGEHITGEGVKEMAYQVQRDSILWMVIDDGQLVGMTYEKEQNVLGWHRHTTPGGAFESVAVIYGAGEEDEVWTIANRTINGSTVRYLERFRPDQYRIQQNKDKTNYWYLDSAIRTTGSGLTEVTGLDHLEGQTVKILVDGAEHASQVVVGGRVNLISPGDTVLTGLAYTSRLEPMKIDVPQQTGSSRTREGKIWRLGFLVWNSLGGHYGENADGETSSDDYDQIVYRQTDAPMDTSPEVFDGEFEVDFDSDFAEAVTVGVLNDSVYPMAILALFPKLKFYGDDE